MRESVSGILKKQIKKEKEKQKVKYNNYSG